MTTCPGHCNTHSFLGTYSIPQYRQDFYTVYILKKKSIICFILGKIYRNFNNMISRCYITIMLIKTCLQNCLNLSSYLCTVKRN